MFGSAFIIILGSVLWVILALWPAIVAKRKGYSFILFFILSIFISWLLGLIIALVIRDKNQTASQRKDEKAAELATERDTNFKD
jgi:phosphotransferase system  glucose/maltose/N-acetylglucosamine-specific IIC component